MTRGGQTYYFHTNAHGDIISVTDSNKNRIATYSYDPWGNILSTSEQVENPYRYAGYRYDSETGLYYLQARYYSPELCRFLTKDKVDEAEKEPLIQNLYVYCTDNPANCVDPHGLWNSYVHYTLTKLWAYSEGFRTQCGKIASACNSVDALWWARGYAHYAILGAHLTAANWLGTAIAVNSLTWLGYAIHAKQDAIGHGWIRPSQHGKGQYKYIDIWSKASRDKQRAVENATKEFLRVFKRFHRAR
jgi:RHS repeat-associated protein